MRVLAVLTVRNEAAFLLDWLAHHMAIGFTDFLVFSNDCQDGTDTMLDHLQELGYLTHIRNDGPYDTRGIQFTALKQAEKLDIVAHADWIMALDIDEYVNIHTGDHSIASLLAELPEATAITLTWRLFGNGDIVRYKDKPITEQFTRCAPEIMHWPWRSAMFKTLYKNNGIYGKLGVHRPRNPDETRLEKARWFDCQARELGDAFKTRRLFSDYGRPMYRLAQLNHYPLGAMESYILKSDRGRAVHGDDKLGMDYWVERNFNTATDTSILEIQGPVKDARARLAAEGNLAELHDQAVAWRHKRFETLMLEEPMRALFARLLMAPPSRPVNARSARALRQFSNAARSKAQQ
ncbi:MAG: glycosyltransferase family 2 protein [Arenibacterium sp.]